jgi:alpha-glucosidase (family GH31 glycosyl hydrolase)
VANTFRYEHLPYLYSLHFAASLRGGTVVRPLFFEFPMDATAHSISYQFMWGSSIMVVPVTYPNVTEIRGYIPSAANWYSISGGYKYGQLVPGGYSTFTAPRDTPLPTFVRAGSIIPKQVPGLTTVESRKNPFHLMVALEVTGPKKGTASGELFWDDGESLVEPIEKADNYYHFTFSMEVKAGKTQFTLNTDKSPKSPVALPPINSLEILGYPSSPNLRLARINGNRIALDRSASYVPTKRSLVIRSPQLIDLNSGGPTWELGWENWEDEL